MEKSNTPLGFTLIELMVTLAIVGILVTVGYPNLSSLFQNNTLSANSRDFVRALNYTRSEANTRGNRVTMCISNANFTQCNDAGDWQDGWLIFNDPANAGVVAAGTLLDVHPKLKGQNISLVGNGLAANEVNNISYTATGTSQARTFILCDNRLFTDNGRHARAIVINGTGRAMAMEGDDSRLPPGVTACTFN